MVMYIGFSTKTHKLHAKLICRKYKHCAPVIVVGKRAVIYQFVNAKKIVPVNVRKQDLKKLKNFGWVFIQYKSKTHCKDIVHIRALTCVQFTKRFFHIKKILIQTPDALFKYLE